MYLFLYGGNMFNYYTNLEKINAQIGELERLKQTMQPPAPITQNFQLAPNSPIRYVNSIDEVNKTNVALDTPFFSQDMAVLWVKNASGEVKSYELKEIIKKDEKDLQIEFLKAQIEEMRKNANDFVNEPIEDEKSTNVSTNRTSKKKSE